MYWGVYEGVYCGGVYWGGLRLLFGLPLRLLRRTPLLLRPLSLLGGLPLLVGPRLLFGRLPGERVRLFAQRVQIVRRFGRIRPEQ